MTWLALAFIGCVSTWWIDMSLCMPIVDQIVDTNEMVEETKLIRHLGYSEDSYVQDIVEYAYMIWGMELVTLLECENWRYRLDGVWDSGHSHGLCQINDRRHKIPENFYDHWKIQVDYCYYLYLNNTKFYWPNRKIKWKPCKEYVLDRFEVLIE